MRTFNKTLTIIMVVIIVLATVIFPASATTKTTTAPQAAAARETAVNFANRMYPGYIVKVVDTYKLTNYQLTHRRGVVIIEKINSISNGNGYSTCTKGYQVYNTRNTHEGNKITTYAVYNPCNDFIDDVTGVTDTTAPNYIR